MRMGFFDEVKKFFWNPSEITKQPMMMLDYLGGIPGIKGTKLVIHKGFEPRTCFLQQIGYNLLDIEWQEKKTRSAGKAAAGAIVGGVLTGGVGLIAGAAIGGRKKDASILVITVEREGIEYDVYVRCDEKKFRQLTDWML